MSAGWSAGWPRRDAIAAVAALVLAAMLQAGGAQWAIAGGLALFLAGLPHGAFDDGGRVLLTGRHYIVRYIGFGLAAGLAFLWQPVAVLAAFLLLSAWHFISEDEAGGTTRRIAVGALAIGGSALVRPVETQAIFAALCGTAIPAPFMIALAAAGVAGYITAAAALLRQPRDPALWLIVASPALCHPVLATGLIFWFGHAGPLTMKLAQKRKWTAGKWAVPAGSAIGATWLITTVLPVTSTLLPWYAAGAVALIVPHLLPLRWLSPAVGRRAAAPQSNQAATSPAT